MTNQMTNCNGCPNNCPREELRCGKGRVIMGMESRSQTQPQSESSHPLVRSLVTCGRIAAHKSEKMRERGVDEDRMFAALSQEEREQLQSMLNRMEERWKADHAKHHAKPVVNSEEKQPN